MKAERFQVVLLPQREQVVSDCTLAEAGAFVRGYHEGHGRGQAVIVLRGCLGPSRRSLARPSKGVAQHENSSLALRSA
jgi:hypothetical protein